MSHDVFISHSSKDKTIADAVVAALESEGIRCWVAPRDVKPGAGWGESITQAISECKLMLLIFSGNSNQSKRVLEEVFFALSEEKTLIPFRIENLDPTGAMRLHLSTLHWLDAYQPSWQVHIERLVESVSVDLGRAAPTPVVEVEPPAPAAREPQKARKKTPWLWVALTVVLLAVLSAAGSLWLSGRNAERDAQSTALAALAQSSETPAATHTPTQTQTPTQTATTTLSPEPSATAEPTQTEAPAWVTEFAEPVLQMIDGRNPNVSTGFDLGIPVWLKFGDCPDHMRPKVSDGELIWNEGDCGIEWSMWYTDFVIEMDVRHLLAQEDRWMFNFRSVPGYHFYSDHIEILDTGGGMRDQVNISLSDPYRLRIIVQGYETALYVNDQPMLYGSLPAGFKNGEATWLHGMPVAFDNIQIWDLNNLK